MGQPSLGETVMNASQDLEEIDLRQNAEIESIGQRKL